MLESWGTQAHPTFSLSLAQITVCPLEFKVNNVFKKNPKKIKILFGLDLLINIV